MALDAADTLSVVLLLVWQCLSTAPEKQKQWLFSKVLPSQTVLESMLASASIVFAPGLPEVVQASTPPSISFFKTLPAEFRKRWAVYVIVLEKQGCRPNLYIGSGTGSVHGVSPRLQHYDMKYNLPSGVATALKGGYSIVHKGLLCWTPSIPSAADVPVSRMLFLALEATFSFVFWAMIGKTEYGYGMAEMCPWGRAALEWDGLCSHSALNEVPRGDFNLSADELEAQALARKRVTAENVARNSKRWAEQNPEAEKAKSKRSKTKALDMETYSCAICVIAFADSNKLRLHEATQLHANKVAIAEGRAVAKPYQCLLCNKDYNTKSEMTRHNKSKSHVSKAARSEQAS